MADDYISQSDNPFSREDYDKLKDAQRLIHDLQPYLDKAEACGVDCAGYRGLSEQFGTMLGMIEKEFMVPAPDQAA